MLQGLWDVTIEVPYMLLLILVIAIGLLSWVVIWARERKLETRDHATGEHRRDPGVPDSL